MGEICGPDRSDATINLRAPPEQRDLIDHAARLRGENRYDFMREAACERARAVVLDQVFSAAPGAICPTPFR